MIYRSTIPVTFPDQTFADFVLEYSTHNPDAIAIIDGVSGRQVSYGELDREVNAVARGFLRLGLEKGDVVALDCPNSPEYVSAFLGVTRAGGVVTTISPLFTAGELGKQLAHSKARFLITVPQLIDKARAAAELSVIEEIVVVGEAEGARSLAGLLVDGPKPDVAIDPAHDIVVMPYSSGTTGLPKGVMLTHRNLVANICQTLATDPCGEAQVVPAILPFFHIYGMVVIMGLYLRTGSTLVTLPRFDFEAFLGLVQKYRATRANLVPPIILALAKHPAVSRFDLGSLTYIMSGAAPLGPEVQDACAERVGCSVRQGYGLTETSPVTHLTPAPPAPQKPGSVGPVIAGTEMLIADLVTDQPLGPGNEGEIWVRGPQVMRGYFNNSDATAAMITPEGWLRTGDIGRVDEDGYLFIVDRAKELIKYKGFQVAPAELEALLLSHPAVADVAVIGVDDEEAGEVPMAFIVRTGDISADALIEFVADNVAPYKKVRFIQFRDAIPKSPSGKILRRVLRAEQKAAGPG